MAYLAPPPLHIIKEHFTPIRLGLTNWHLYNRNAVRGKDWPARSPDLNPLDFFLWGYLKAKVYETAPTILDELEANIRTAIADIDDNLLQRVVSDFRKRCRKCIANNGGGVGMNMNIRVQVFARTKLSFL